MSKRNSRAAKAQRRKDRQAHDQQADGLNANSVNGVPDGDLVDVTPIGELVDLAERGETLSCGCDAHAMLHEALAVQAGHLPDGWQRF